MTRNPIPYGRQSISDEDIKEVAATLRSDFLTQGPKIGEFENAFAKYIGSKYAVAVTNGTAALHLSALALDVRTKQKVITSPITFAASANCIKYCGGDIAFADIDPLTYLLDLKKVENMLDASPSGTYSGIVPVDFAGRSVNMEIVKKLAEKYGLWIIEDACHAPGGFFKDTNGNNEFCGSGKYADLAIFSFHPVKHIACGEGGMITTNDPKLYERLLILRTHGITRRTESFTNDMIWASGNSTEVITNYPGWYMEMNELGYNYRLTDFQAALGISQLKRADAGLGRRRQIAVNYDIAFKGKPWLKGQSGISQGHAYHLYVVEVENRLGLYNHLRIKNIFPQVHYIPVHLMPFYKSQGFNHGDYPKAENFYAQCLSLPMYPSLSSEEQEYVIFSINEFYKT